MKRLFSRTRHYEPVVLGEELAAARHAERKRLEAASGDRSPMPSASYDQWRGELNLAKPTLVSLDDELADLCRRLGEVDAAERAATRRAISMDEFYTLLTFSRRSAVFALRGRRLEHVRDGLTAITLIEADRVDFRDIMVALSLLHYAATRIGIDASRQFSDAAALSEPGVATLINDFAERSPEHRDLRDAWGHIEITTADGPGLVRWGFRAYDPTFDLAGIALDIAGVLEVDAYQPDDPELATELPAVWLRHASKDDLTAALRAVRAAATIHGRLRPGASPTHASQQLTAFLVELRDASLAQRLDAMSRRPSDSYALLGIAVGTLFCLIAARSFVEGVNAFETRDSLARFRPGIQAVLERHWAGVA